MKKLFENWRKQINEAEYEPGRAVADLEDSMDEPEYSSDVPELSFEESERYIEALQQITKAVESGALPESVEDAFYEMLPKLGIYL